VKLLQLGLNVCIKCLSDWQYLAIVSHKGSSFYFYPLDSLYVFLQKDTQEELHLMKMVANCC